MNQSCTFPSQTNLLVDAVLERVRESVVDERDVLGPIHDSIPPPSEPPPPVSPSSRPQPFRLAPSPMQMRTVITRPRRAVRWPVVLCGLIALFSGGAAVVESPLVGEGAVERAAIAIHDAVF